MKVRIPFIPLSFTQEFTSIPGELMVDYQEHILYIRNNNNISIRIPNETDILSTLTVFHNTILNGVDIDHNTLRKNELRLLDVKQWFDYHMNNTSDSIVSALSAFSNYDFSYGRLIDRLNTKLDVVAGKTLSTNDFTLIEKNKIINLPANANNYKHPSFKVCNYVPDIVSVNGKTGSNVIITKLDIAGLGNIHPFANYYEHPPYQVCGYDFPVKSLDGKTGDVIVTKVEAELNLVENLPIVESIDELYNPDPLDEKYVTLKTLNSFVKNMIYGDGVIDDGRFAVKITIDPSYCNALFKLKREAENQFETVSWTYGRKFRLYPGTYEYKIDSNVDWLGQEGFIEVVDKDLEVVIKVQEIPKYYAKVINIKGPRIKEVYYSEFPYTTQLKGLLSNGIGIMRTTPTVRYRYTLKFDGYPDATGTFHMPRHDILIIHDGGGTTNDNGGSIGTMDDIPDPPKQGEVAFDTEPANATVTMKGLGNTYTGKKKYEIEFDTTYEYTASAEGYLDYVGVFSIPPWMVSENVKVKLNKISSIDIKVHPILPDLVNIQLEVNGSWLNMELSDKYHNFKVFDNETSVGLVDDEYGLYQIKNLPSGKYKYKGLFNGVEFTSGTIDHVVEDPKETKITLPTGIARYSTLILDTNADREGMEIIINTDGDMNRWEDFINDTYKMVDSFDTIVIQIRKSGYYQYSGTFKLNGNASMVGGYTTLNINLIKENLGVGDSEELPPGSSETPNPSKPIINTKRVLFRVIPGGPQTVMLVDKGMIPVKDIIIDDIEYKEFFVEYGWEYTYTIMRDGYQLHEDIFCKDATIPPGEVEKVITLKELAKCMIKLSPITLDGITVKLFTDDKWVEVPLKGEEIPYEEYQIITGVATTDMQYKLFYLVDISSGDKEYKVYYKGNEIYSGEIYHSREEGSETIVKLGSHPDRYYEVKFKAVNEMGVDISTAMSISILENDEWIGNPTNVYKLYGADTPKITYRINANGYAVFKGILDFKDTAVMGGGKVLAISKMIEGEGPGADSAGDPNLLNPNQRYLWVEIDPDAATLTLTTPTYSCGTQQNPRSCRYYDFKDDGFVVKNGTRCRQFIITRNTSNEMMQFYLKAELQDYEPETHYIRYSDLANNDKIHKVIVLQEWGLFYIGINPVTIDGVTLSVQDPKDPTKMISFKKIGTENGQYVKTINLPSRVKDDQHDKYMLGLGIGKAKYGSYKYRLMKGGNLLKEGTILHAKLPSTRQDPKDYPSMIYIGDHDTRYNKVQFIPTAQDDSHLFNAKLYLFENGVWVNKGVNRTITMPPLQKNLYYAFVIDGYSTYYGDVKFKENGVTTGKFTIIEPNMYLGKAEFPTKNPTDMDPTDPYTVPLGKMILKVIMYHAKGSAPRNVTFGLPAESVELKTGPRFSLNLSEKPREVRENGVWYYEYIIDESRLNNITYTIKDVIGLDETDGWDYIEKKLSYSGYLVADSYDPESNNGVYIVSVGQLEVTVDPYTIDNLSIYFIDTTINPTRNSTTYIYRYGNFGNTYYAQYATNLIVLSSPTTYSDRFRKYLAIAKQSYMGMESNVKDEGSIFYTDRFRLSLGSHISRYHEITVVPYSGSILNTDITYSFWDVDLPGWRTNRSGVFRLYGNKSRIKFKVEKPGFKPYIWDYNLGADAIHGGRPWKLKAYLNPYDETRYIDVKFKTRLTKTVWDTTLYVPIEIKIEDRWIKVEPGSSHRFYDEGEFELKLPDKIRFEYKQNGSHITPRVTNEMWSNREYTTANRVSGSNHTHYLRIILYPDQTSDTRVFDEYR